MLLAQLFALRDTGVASGSARVHQVAEPDFFVARTVQDGLLHRLGQGLERLIEVELVMFGQALEQRKVVAVAPVPALDGAAGQAQRRKRHHARRVKELLHSEAVAGRARSHGRVEREQARLEFRDRITAHGAGELGVEEVGLRLALTPTLSRGESEFIHPPARWERARVKVMHFERDGATAGQAQRGFETLGQALREFRAHLDAVDHDVDVVLLGLLQGRQIVVLERLAIDSEPHIALRLHLGKQVEELALFLARHGRENHQPGACRQGQHCVHHLAHGLGLQRQIVLGAKRRASAGKQQAQVIVDFGDCAHGGARIVRGGFLLDRDRGA